MIDSDSSEVARLNKQATALKKAGDMPGAIAALRRVKALEGDLYQETRLAKFLQDAGQLDAALAEIQWLLDHSQAQAQASFGHQPTSVIQCQRAGWCARVHAAAALICKRSKRLDMQVQHEALQARYAALAQRLRPLADTDRKTKFMAWEKAKSLGVTKAVRAYADRQTMKRKAIFVAVTALVALAIFGNVMNNIEASRAEAAAQAERVEKQRLAQEKRDALAAEFVANKPQLLDKAQRLIDVRDPVAAQTLLAKFSPLKDPQVASLQALATKSAQTAQSIKQLSDELANKPGPVRAVVIYQELAALEPSNPLWRVMMEDAKPLADAIKSQQAKADAVAARQAAVKLLFSPWDGSVHSVEEAIKSRLKDPDSYKHVETRFTDSGSGNVTVFTQYRARNSFNAVVPGTATAVVSPTGELVSFTLNN